MPKWQTTIWQVNGRVRERLHKRKLELPYRSSNRIQYDKLIQALATALKRARIRWSRVCTANQRTTQQNQPNQRLDEGQRMIQVWPERTYSNCMSHKEKQQRFRWWLQNQKVIVRIVQKNESQWKEEKEAKQFVQEDDEEDEESNNHGFASFGFRTVNKRDKLQLRA